MTNDLKILIVTAVLANFPADAMIPPPAPIVRVVVGDDEGGKDATPGPPALDLGPEQQAELRRLAEQVEHAHRARVDAEQSDDPDEQE